MARDCKKCMYFQGMHPKYNDSFGCQLDPNCSWIEYKEKKVCKNYITKEEFYGTKESTIKELKESFFGRKRWYDADSVDSRIKELEAKNLVLAEKLKSTDEELCEIKNKFREFNDKVCRKVVDAAKTLSSISQCSQMDFYEEFIKG